MGIFTKIRAFFGSFRSKDTASPPFGRTLPEPVRANLRDHERPGEHFFHLDDWSSWRPADPAWQLPDVEVQRSSIAARISQHSTSGDLDGLVPDLLDLEIHHEMNEVRRTIDSSEIAIQRTEQELFEQATIHQHQLSDTLQDRAKELETLYGLYGETYAFLTGRMPVTPSYDGVLRPLLIPAGSAGLESPLDDVGDRQQPDPRYSTITALPIGNHDPHGQNAHTGEDTAPAPILAEGDQASRNVRSRFLTTSPGQRPPGLKAPGFLWIFMGVAWMGMALDTLLGKKIFEQLFDFSESWTIMLMIALGLACAALATKVGIDLAYGHTTAAVLQLVFVLGIGIALAYARLALGFTAEDLGPNVVGTPVEENNEEWPATVLMLVLYIGSALAALFTAQKVFVAERSTLRTTKKKIDMLSAKQAHDKAEYAAIHERIAARSSLQKNLQDLYTYALRQADHREAYLKAYARDAIARAIGRPDATPLIRAPYLPSED